MKLVKESLNEFQKGLDPIDSLGLGRRAQIRDWLDSHDIINYTINDDYTIDVDGNVNLISKNLTEIPEFIQFNIVEGNFDLESNKLTSLRGCPKSVYGYFACSLNLLSSLEYSPEYVRKNFYCYDNKVKFTKDDVDQVCKSGDYIYV